MGKETHLEIFHLEIERGKIHKIRETDREREREREREFCAKER